MIILFGLLLTEPNLACCALIKHGDLHVANLGDSRAVASVGRADKTMTVDHNTSNPRERERVTAMGGIIKENRVGGVLIPTRYRLYDT
jgi:serine/threonine protein phosphatase PrpC